MTNEVIETKYGWHQKNEDKTNVDDIVGLIKTDEQTNSVELKKEAQLHICEKRVRELKKENEELKSENNMLKVTIGRNEAYISRMQHKGEWRTDTITSNR